MLNRRGVSDAILKKKHRRCECNKNVRIISSAHVFQLILVKKLTKIM